MTEGLDQKPVSDLKGVGPRLAEKLAGLGIHSVQDLLFHLPLRYQDRTRLTPIGALRMGDDAMIEGTVAASDIAFGRRRSLVCRVQDGTGTVSLRFFYFNANQKSALSRGAHVRCYGEVRRGSSGLELFHPEFRVISEQDSPDMNETLTPVYPSTEGVQQAGWLKLQQQSIAALNEQGIDELIPETIRHNYSLGDALNYLHHPPTNANLNQLAEGLHPAQQRLAVEELLAHNLALQQVRQVIQQQRAARLRHKPELNTQFLDLLGFTPTAAQSRVSEEIHRDLASGIPMLRLVQGDVGCGKTVVAAMAALAAIGCHTQAALMAPTEILAEQHYQTFVSWFEPLGIEVAWLSGKIKGKKRAAVLEQIASGKAALAVGTHALFQAEVQFHNLSLAIIDEQHRFGVHQRLALREKGSQGNGAPMPHQLIMTATPIPRTLAMSAYADLDTSIIDELPPGRTPVNTVVLSNERRADIVARLQRVCSTGQQAYWVCTLIDESEAVEAQAAEDAAKDLHEALPDLSIALVHGRMKPAEKAEVMARFKAGDIDLLVATTVIEVGVDVPNASLMIIENAERLGLAQLHQLRGRVGRGIAESHCVLLYQAPLSRNGRERLQALRDSNDGFVIAEKDLALRGPGEVMGTRQTGLMQMKIADLQRDHHLLEQVRRLAKEYENKPKLAERLIQRWLGSKLDYGNV